MVISSNHDVEVIQSTVDHSFHKYDIPQYNILHSLPISIKPIILRIGLISFGFGQYQEKLLKKTPPIKPDDWTLYYLPCNPLGHEYYRFYFKALRKFVENKAADLFIVNEYAFPSFSEKKCPKKMKHSHREILDKLIKLVNDRNILLFTGTLNVCDESIPNYYGFSQGYFLHSSGPHMPVRKHTFAQEYNGDIQDHTSIERFKRSDNAKLYVFRTPFGNLGFSICADFINQSNKSFFIDNMSGRPDRLNPELSLLIVPSRDRSWRVLDRAKNLSREVNYGIAWVNALDFPKKGKVAQGLVCNGKEESAILRDEERDDKKGFKAQMKVFKFDLISPAINRYKKYKDSPITRKMKS